MRCSSAGQLLAYAQNELVGRESKGIRTHLGQCRTCRHRLSQLQKILSVTATRSLMGPLEGLVHQAVTLFDWRRSAPAGGLRKRIPALLVVDSLAEDRLLGLRGAGVMSRQMLYRAAEYDIDLVIDCLASSPVVDIIGQVMPLADDLATVAAAEVELVEASRVAFAAKTNDFGEFIFDGVPEGIYDLRIRVKDEVIDVARFRATVHFQEGTPANKV